MVADVEMTKGPAGEDLAESYLEEREANQDLAMDGAVSLVHLIEGLKKHGSNPSAPPRNKANPQDVDGDDSGRRTGRHQRMICCSGFAIFWE